MQHAQERRECGQGTMEKPEEKISLKDTCRKEDYFIMELRVIGRNDMDWIHLA
jgi:hypothetical protein